MVHRIGEIYAAKVIGIKKFGAFVRLATGESGMVHISEISQGFVEDISKHLSDNQDVKVRLIKIAEDGKLAFSIKQTEEKLQKPKDKPQGGILWRPKAVQNTEDMSFEDKMLRFKSQSEEKMSDYKKSRDVKKGSSYSKRK